MKDTKTFIIGSIILMALAWLATAGEVRLAWNASGTTNVSYTIRATKGTNAVSINVGTNLTAHVDELSTGLWSFEVFANAGGVLSDPGVLQVSVPEPVTGLRTVFIEQVIDLKTGQSTNIGMFRLRIP